MFRIRKPRPMSAPDVSRLDVLDGVGGYVRDPEIPATVSCTIYGEPVEDRPLPDDVLAIVRAVGIMHDAELEEERRLAAEERRLERAANEAAFQFGQHGDAVAAMATFRSMGGAA